MAPHQKREWEPVIKNLFQLIKDRGWSEDFMKAIQDAKAPISPSDLDNIHSINDYLDYLNDFLFWIPTENERGSLVYDKICLFYWIIKQHSMSQHETLVKPESEGTKLTHLSEWMVDYANALGAFYDKPESINKDSIQSFYESKAYHMWDYYRPENDWQTFNEFFARRVLNGHRKPDSDDTDTISSPADSVFDGFWEVGSKSTISVKGLTWDIGSLLDGSKHAKKFKDGRFMHAFLNTTDYHRQHAPVAGKIIEAKVISGAVYLDVVLDGDNTQADPDTPEKETTHRHADQSGREAPPKSQYKLAMRRGINKDEVHLGEIGLKDNDADHLEAPDKAGYQFLQARGCIIIDSAIGLVAVLPIGMAQVSSVKLSVEEGQEVKKGDEISYFQFGGSDIVMVFQAESNVQFAVELGTHYNTGETIAIANRDT